jgi:hypothetical protein
MLSDFLQKAISLNADRLEIEYKDGEEWITAFRGDMGVGIGSVDSTQRDKLFEELEQFRKSKQVTLLGKVYRLRFSEYESFGETVYEIGWKQSQ